MPRNLGRVLCGLRRLAERTPESRNRHVDFLRAAAISMVVVGHWLAIVVVYDGGFRGGNALAVLPWTHPLTWLFQVMPVFFLVGGYANGTSLGSHYRRGGDATSWLLARTGRLLGPTTVFFALLAVTAVLARVVGVAPRLIGLATWMVSIPLWFLAVYLAVVVLAPLTYALHRRAGLAVPVVLAVVVGVLDSVRMGLGFPAVAGANYLLAWLAVHQLGFAWQDGRLRARARVALPMAAVGAGALVSLTVLGPYPVSMVGVPGEAQQNTAPPTLALLALALAQTGIVLSLDGPVNRWLRRIGPWMVVVAVNAVVLTVFLWHMAAAMVAAVALYPTGVLPQPQVTSASWVVWRLPWLACVALVLIVFVAVFGWIELRTGPSASGRRIGGRGRRAMAKPCSSVGTVATAVGLAFVLGGFVGVAVSEQGYHGLGGQPTEALAAYLFGVAVLWIVRRRTFAR